MIHDRSMGLNSSVIVVGLIDLGIIPRLGPEMALVAAFRWSWIYANYGSVGCN